MSYPNDQKSDFTTYKLFIQSVFYINRKIVKPQAKTQ